MTQTRIDPNVATNKQMRMTSQFKRLFCSGARHGCENPCELRNDPATADLFTLIGEYHELKRTQDKSGATKVQEDICANTPENICQRYIDCYRGTCTGEICALDETAILNDTLSLELALVAQIGQNQLTAKQWSLEHTYRSLLGEKKFYEFKSAQPHTALQSPTASSAAGATGGQANCNPSLIAYLSDIVRGKRWIYRNERIRSSLLSEQVRAARCSLKWAVFISLFLLAGLFYVQHGCQETAGEFGWYVFVSFLLSIGAAGIVGACLSLLRRLKTAANTPIAQRNPSVDLMAMNNRQISSARTSIVTGAASAYVLYIAMLAAGTFLRIDLLPNFSCSSACCGPGCADGLSFACLFPQGVTDYAKLYFYALLAGFAERLVPDILDRMTLSRADEN